MKNEHFCGITKLMMTLSLLVVVSLALNSCGSKRKTVMVNCPTAGAVIEVDGDYEGSQQATFKVKRWCSIKVSAPNYVPKTFILDRHSEDVTDVCLDIDRFDLTANGENLSALTKITDNSDCMCPVGGDQGGTLFFIFSNNDSYANLYKKENPLSASMTQMTDGKNYIVFPTYCKKTNKVAFRAKLEGSSSSDIYMMNANQGKALTQVTNTPNHTEDNPCFSQDGRYIVYVKYPISGGTHQIWIKDLETGENTMLGPGTTPSFSWDGKKIVYARSSNDGVHAYIWTMDIDGENQTQLTDASLKSAQRPRFSPDGRHIVFDATDESGNFDIYVINKDGSNLTRLTLNKSQDVQPYWSQDGYIYFTSDRGDKKDNLNIWRFKY